MSIEKSEALVLRVIPFRDTSRILTAYTAEHGLVSLIAKGVRGPKPRFGAALELFAVSDLVYYHRNTRELQLLAQAALLEAHLGLTGDLRRYAYASGVLEFLLRALAGQEPPGRVYALTLRTLEVLETAAPEALHGVFRAFLIKAVSFLGHRPELFACVECRKPVEGEAVFAPAHGGVVCADCAADLAGGVRLGAGALAWLRRLLGSPLAEIAGEAAPRAVEAEGARVMELFLSHHVERYEPLRSVHLAAHVEKP